MNQFYFFKNQDQYKEKKTAAEARMVAERTYASQRTTDIASASYVIAHGGDGTMLDTLREIAAYKKAHPDWQTPTAIGINYGDVGYLMNKPTLDFNTLIAQAEVVHVHPLEVTIQDENGKTYHRTAFNDFVAHSDSRNGQSCHLLINSIGRKPVQDMVVKGNGIIISTPVGSSAYYRNAGGQPFSIQSPLLGLQPICSVDAANKIGGLYPSSQKFVIDVLNENRKRPVYANTDNDERIDNVTHCEIVSSQQSFPILMGYYCPARQQRFRS